MALLSAVLPPSQTPSENAVYTYDNPNDTAAAHVTGYWNYSQYPHQSLR